MTTDSTLDSRPSSRPLVAVSSVAAAAFSLLTAAQIAAPPQTYPFSRLSDYAIEALFLAGLVAATIAVVLLHRRHGWGWFGAVAAATTGAGTGLLAVVVGATLASGRDVLGMLFPRRSRHGRLVGVLLAVATFRARLLPRPVALLLGAAVPLAAVIGEPAGPAVFAVLWAAVAVTGRE